MPAVAPQLKKVGRSDGAHDDDLELEGAGARWVRPKQHQPPGFIRSAVG